MKHSQTKSDVMGDLKRVIQKKEASLESLHKQSRRVKLEIQSAMTALHSALKAREMWLLNKVDVITHSQESSVKRQQNILHEAVGLLSHKNADHLDVRAATAKLQEYCQCSSVGLSFLSNIKEMKQQLLNFGNVESSNILQEKGKHGYFENPKQHQDDSLSSSINIGIEQYKSLVLAPEEKSQPIETTKCSSLGSFRFDFTANKFIQTTAIDVPRDSECLSSTEVQSSSDNKVINSSGSFYYDFSANKFIPTSSRYGHKDTNCISLPKTEGPSKSETKKSPGSFCFNFSANRFIETSNGDEFKDVELSLTSSKSGSTATNESPSSFRFDFKAKKFVQTSEDVQSRNRTLVTPTPSGEETALIQNQSSNNSVPSFHFSFNENKFLASVEDEDCYSCDLSDQSCVIDASDRHIGTAYLSDEVHSEDPLSTLCDEINWLLVD